MHAGLDDDARAALLRRLQPGGDNSTVCTDFGSILARRGLRDRQSRRREGSRARSATGRTGRPAPAPRASQKPVLDRPLAAADPAGIAIGSLGDCTPATAEGGQAAGQGDRRHGKKKASDPAFGLAAQLLAARLNIAAGAGQLRGGSDRNQRRPDAPCSHQLQRDHARQAERCAGDAGERSRERARPLQQRQSLLSLSARGARSPLRSGRACVHAGAPPSRAPAPRGARG